MQVHILHCPALGMASPQLMRKLSARVFDSLQHAKQAIEYELQTSFELYSMDDFRELWNSPQCCTLFPDASFIANIYVKE